MPKQLFILVYLLVCATLYAQQPFPDSSMSGNSTASGAIRAFHQSAGQQSQLYNGRIHIAYPVNLIGSAYYLSNDPQSGAVEYDHILFSDVPLRYDEVRDKVVVQHFNVVSAFELVSERVSRFWLGQHAFIRLVQEPADTDHTPATGFYEVLCTGKVTLLARRKKGVTDFIESMEVKQRIDLKESFFAKAGDVYYPVNTQRSLLAVLSDRKKEVQQYLKRSGPKFRKEPENYLVRATTYYNQLIR